MHVPDSISLPRPGALGNFFSRHAAELLGGQSKGSKDESPAAVGRKKGHRTHQVAGSLPRTIPIFIHFRPPASAPFRGNSAAVRVNRVAAQILFNPLPQPRSEVVLNPFRRRVEVIDRQFSMPPQPGFPEPV